MTGRSLQTTFSVFLLQYLLQNLFSGSAQSPTEMPTKYTLSLLHTSESLV